MSATNILTPQQVVLDHHPSRGHHGPRAGAGAGAENKQSADDFGAAAGLRLPMLVYVSREKDPNYDHNTKAASLNAQLRVSALLSNEQLLINFAWDHYVTKS